MTAFAKVVVATGASSGLGFEAIKQLLAQAQPHRFILGCRNTTTVQSAYDGLSYDNKQHTVTLLPLELTDLRMVKRFASETIETLGSDRLDILMLNAAVMKPANEPGVNGSKWSEQYVVNHLAQHYLIHLLREKLAASRSRIVVVSSGSVTRVTDPSTLNDTVNAQSGAEFQPLYSATKFIQLLGAHWWRRQLQGQCRVLAVSPGLILDTGLSRNVEFKPPAGIMKDAKTTEEGARSILEAFTRDDFPADPEQIFLTSWGDWWPKDVYVLSLEKALQDKWSPSKEQIEEEELVD